MRYIGFFCFFLLAFTMDKPAYQFFEAKGKKTTYQDLLKETQQADIVLFGEQHNNPICHWLQLQLTKDLYQVKKENLVLGAEMFEADDQVVLDEYLKGYIKESNFVKEAKVWDNYSTDYRPLVEFAKANQLFFCATNIPRRYASLVAKDGFEGLNKLSVEAKKWIVPLPVEVDLTLSGYDNMMKMMQHSGTMKPENFAYAQAIKDATMAHFILNSWQKGKTALHYNGSYHSDDFQGIMWYLKKQNPKLKIVTIASVEQAQLENLDKEYQNKATYVLVVPDDMTKTY